MISKAVHRFIMILPVFLILGILTAGCSSGGSLSSDENRAASTQTAVSESGTPSPVDAVGATPSSEVGEQTSDTPATGAVETPAGAPQKPVVADTDPTATQSPSSTDRIVKTPVPTKKPVSESANKPSPTVKPVTSPSAAPADTSEKGNTVTISITGDGESGVILAPSEVEVQKGDSVMDLLKRITRKHKIQMEFKGIGSFTYVEGIDNLYEYDNGAESGWMYRVNGEFPDEGAGSYTVNPGDQIEWLYTLDLGKDIGAKTP